VFIPTVRNSAIRNCCNYATARNRRFDGNRRGGGGGEAVRREIEWIERRRKRHVFRIPLQDTGRQLSFPSFLNSRSMFSRASFRGILLSVRKSAKPAIIVIIRPPLQPHDDRDWIQTVGCACYKPRVGWSFRTCVTLQKRRTMERVFQRCVSKKKQDSRLSY